MSQRRISVHGLRLALRAGIGRVAAHQEELNRINVFPLPDRDTGTNLGFMLGAVLPVLRRRPPPDVAGLLRQVATEAADGARGNAGSILAHYVHGVAAALPAGRPVTLEVLAPALAAGAAEARLTMAEPCEGTILSVMQVFADAMQAQVAAGENDLGPALRHSLNLTRVALHRTREQLKPLQAAGVVDAGARGFVELLEGIGEAYVRGREAVRGAALPEPPMPGIDVFAGRAGAGPVRYRVACTVRAEAVDRPALKAALRELSAARIVLAGTRARLRLQAETDDPGPLLATAAKFGELAAQSTVEISGAGSVPARRRQVAIVTDSGSDMPLEEVERLGIHIVPQRLSLDGREHVDGVSITPHEFYGAMRDRGAVPRTSQPAPGDFRRMFELQLTQHEEVLDVSLARKLSGTMQSAVNAAVRSDPRRVTVFDTEQVAAGQGLMVLWAAEAAQAGHGTARLIEGLERMRPRTKVYAIVRDIRYGVRGGRIPKAALPVTRLLRLSLILCSKDGRLGLAGALLGRHSLPERFARKIARSLDPARRYRIIVGHGACPGDAAVVERTLRRHVSAIDHLWVVETGVAIGAHAGPGCLVIAVQDYEPPSP